MTTQQAIEALHALPRMGQGKPGLARMQNLMDHLGNPEKDLQCIHIAGTNGKGSLAAMTSAILTAAGYKTGLTISPYVVDFRERFQIDGEMIPPRTLANLTEKVLDAIDAIETEGGEKPVEFEAVTALAFLWFAREKCDLVVLETGLGGRCDATNVVPQMNAASRSMRFPRKCMNRVLQSVCHVIAQKGEKKTGTHAHACLYCMLFPRLRQAL